MTPTERRLEILAVLQTWPGITAAKLAERLAVSERTARRDVEHLRRIGYGIDGESGRYGGYVLSRGIRLPPLVLDADEAAAVALGLASDLGVTGLELAAGTALAKLTETAPTRARSTLVALGSAALAPRLGRPASSHRVLLTLAQACRQGEAVQLRQRPARSGQERRITVQPHRLVKVGNRWYLVGWAKGRPEWGLYAVERISRVDPLGTRLSAPPSPPEDLSEFARRFLANRPRRHSVRVRLHTSAELARDLVNPAAGTIVDEGSSCTLSLETDDLDWAARYLIYLNLDFDVLAPAELTAALHALGCWLARRHV